MTNAYTLNNIKVNYHNKCILDIGQLAIPAEKCIALLGDNGAGKSTLLQLLALLNQADKGSLCLFDQPVQWPINSSLRRKIAFVSQHPYLLAGSVEDNVKLALKLQGIKSSQHQPLINIALEQTQTSHLAKQSAQTLSGGELKRVAIARAIAYQPDILLLDEPFSHLDIQHIQHLEQHIDSFSKQLGKTVIFSTHDRLQGKALAQQTINLVAGVNTDTPLINVFSGKAKQHSFDTGKIIIYTNNNQSAASHIAIDPNQIIISTSPLESSMRNSLIGRVMLIAQQQDTIRLSVECGELFHVTISLESLQQFKLNLGDEIYLSFKSTAVSVF